MKKRLAVIAATAVMALSMSMTAFAGSWKQNEVGWWWEEDDGSYPVSSWKELDGKWYYFGQNGYMFANSWAQIPYTYTYAGAQVTNNEWFAFDASGAMLTSGTWEGGYLDSTASYFRGYECGIGANGQLWYSGGIDSLHYTAYPWKTTFANAVYHLVESNASSTQVLTMDYQLPANWTNECPLPDICNIISMCCASTWSECYSYYVSTQNNVAHIEVWYTE